MIRLDETFEPDIKYIYKLLTSQENYIKDNGIYNDIIYQKD